MITSQQYLPTTAVFCIFPFRLETLQHIRTDLTCARSLPLAIAKRSHGRHGRLLSQSSITDFTHFPMLTTRRFALMQVVENAV